ncbi:MAG: hypothetical protein ACJ8MR_19240, partial [Povalibacter sp.]
MRTYSLRVRLLAIAVAAGLCITAILLGLEYLEYRKSVDAMAERGERSLLASEGQRLEREGSAIIGTHVSGLEVALASNDSRAIAQLGAALLSNAIVTSVTISNSTGKQIYSDQKDDPWVATLSPQEQRKVERTLGATKVLGVVQLKVGKAGLIASAQGWRAQMERGERVEFGRWIWIISAAGFFITGVLAIVAWLLARRLERPIIELIRSAERIGEGDYTR